MSSDHDLSAPVPGSEPRSRLGRWLVPLVAWVLYVLLYPWFQASFGIHSGVLAFAPVVLTALRGTWPGVIAGLLAAPTTDLLNVAFSGSVPFSWLASPAALLGWVAMLAVGFVVGRMRDLDRKTRAETAERRRMEQHLREREVRLSISSDIARAMRDDQPAERIIRAAIDSLHLHFPDLRAAFSLVDRDGLVTVAQSVGPNGTDWPSGESLVLPATVVEALPSRDLIAIEDSEHAVKDPGLLAGLAARNVRASLDAPVHFSEALVGLLSLDSPTPRRWSPHERATLREAADLLGVALRDADGRRRLEESERKFRLVAESSQAIIALLQDTGAAYLNPEFARLSGYTREELPKVSLWDIIHPDDREMIRSFRSRRLARQEAPSSYEVRIVTKTGETRWVDMRASTFQLDGKQTILTTGLDITERKLADQGLRASEARLRTLMEHLQDGVSLIVGRVTVYANPGLARLKGCPVDALVGRDPLANLLPSDRQRAAARLEAVAAGELGTPVEYSLQRADGTVVPVLATSRPIELDGRPAVLSVVRDLSEQRELEEQLRQTHRLETVGQLAGGVAHNFNNALAGIIGYAELTLRELPADHVVRDDVNQILAVAERSAALTRQLLAFSRKEPVRATAFSLNEAVEETMTLIGPLLGEQVELQLQLDDTLRSVVADRHQIEEVVTNLAINARDAMADGGTLTIATEATSVTDAEARVYPYASSGEFARLTVSDTGAGMDRKTLRRVFEPFFTTKEPGKGVGLGLSMVHGVITQSGGFVRVDSDVGRGTTFRLYLPVDVDAPGEIAGAAHDSATT